jgi:hypothetical protein
MRAYWNTSLFQGQGGSGDAVPERPWSRRLRRARRALLSRGGHYRCARPRGRPAGAAGLRPVLDPATRSHEMAAARERKQQGS